MIEPVEKSFLGLSAHGFHRVAYQQWGNGPRAIVCVHGLTRNAHDFDRLAPRLAERLNATVVCPSIVGRGASDWLVDKTAYTYALYLNDMAGLIARLEVDTVDWVGSSMGGLIGIMLAASPRTPVRTLVINDVGPFVPKAALERIRDYIGHDPRFADVAALESYLREVYRVWGPMTDEDWRHMARHSARTLPDGGVGLAYDPGVAANFRNVELTDVNLWPLWNLITAPTLVLRGAISDLLLADTARLMTETGPKARLIEVPDVGHCPSLMDASQTDAIVDFLAAHPA